MTQPTQHSRLTTANTSHVPLEGAFGKYRIERVLGSGASSTVYLAQDTIFDRSVALKVIHPKSQSPQDHRERFIREARSIARINHPRIVSVFDVNEIDGRPYIAMESMQGGSAQQAIDQRGPIPWQEATQWMIDACDAVASAHQANMLHRDIKPGNLLLDGDGRAKLGDFGLVKLTSDHDSNLTQTGSPIGTPSFMSPEQCRSEALDESSDVYSLGATYYALLSGKPPFQADSALGVMFAHCSSPPPVLPMEIGLPNDCEQIIHRAMQKDPSKRFESASELAHALNQLLGRPVLAPPEAKPSLKRYFWAIPAALVSVVILAILIRPPAKLPPASQSSSRPTPGAPALDKPATNPTPSLTETAAPLTGEVFPNLIKVAQHRGDVTDMEFTNSGRYLVSVGRTGALAVWDPTVPEKWMRRMVDEQRRSEKLFALALIPKRSIAIVGGEGSELTVWDYDKSTLLQRLPHKHGRVRSIDVSPRGDRMMTGGDIGWNMWTISPQLEFADQGPIEEGMLLVHSVRFSTIQEVIGGVSGNGMISLKSLDHPESNKTIRVDGQVISFAFGKTRCDLAYGIDQRMITVGTSSNRLKPITMRYLPSNPLSIEYSPVRRQLASGGDNGSVILVDLDSGKRHLFHIGEASRILVLRYAPDGESLAIGTGVGKLFLAPLPNDRFDPPTPPRELALDRLTNRIPTQETIRNPLKSLQSLLSPPTEEDQP